MSRRLNVVRVNPATVLNLRYPKFVIPKPTRPPHGQAQQNRKPDTLKPSDCAECPRCRRRFELLPGCPLRDVEGCYDEEEIRYYENGMSVLKPDTECYECSYGNRASGWVPLVDMFIGEEPSQQEREWQRRKLKEHYDEVERGERVEHTLRLIWSPKVGEVEERLRNEKNRENHYRMQLRMREERRMCQSRRREG